MSCGLGGPNGIPVSEHLGTGYTGFVTPGPFAPAGQFYDYDTSWRPQAPLQQVEPIRPILMESQPIPPPLKLPDTKPFVIPSSEPVWLRPDLNRIVSLHGRYDDGHSF